jgi:hypothetical protein
VVGNSDGGLEAEDGAVELHAGGNIADYKVGREFLEFHGVSPDGLGMGGRGLICI